MPNDLQKTAKLIPTASPLRDEDQEVLGEPSEEASKNANFFVPSIFSQFFFL